MFKLIIFTLLLNFFLAINFHRTNNVGMLKPPTYSHLLFVEDQWFEQKLDHFSSSDTRVWKQRYLKRSDYFQCGSPVFLFIGGEGMLSKKWMYAGAWLDYARDNHALCYAIEHRFYGKSFPTDDMSVENLEYLSSEQALADIAAFIESQRDTMRRYHRDGTNTWCPPHDERWIVFGGSYSGSLAAWLRLKYPHLVYGAIASSAPLLAKLDFSEYLDVTTNSVLLASGMSCYKSISSAFQQLMKLIKSGSYERITNDFRLCSPLDGVNRQDLINLVSLLIDYFANTVQYNEDNRISSDSQEIILNISKLCDIMNADSKNSLVGLQRLNDIFLDKKFTLNKFDSHFPHTSYSCLEHRYSKVVEELSNIDFASNYNTGGRQWIYQTCTEFGWYQTSDAHRQIFGDYLPLDFFIQLCRDVFDTNFTKALIENSVISTNTMYGAKDIASSNIVFVNGNIDPWHAMSLTQSSSAHKVYYINGTAHCANMYPVSKHDLPSLVATRELIGGDISAWVEQSRRDKFYYNYKSTDV